MKIGSLLRRNSLKSRLTCIAATRLRKSSNDLWSSKCTMLRRVPVKKLSTHKTSWPASSRRSHRCEPRNPRAAGHQNPLIHLPSLERAASKIRFRSRRSGLIVQAASRASRSKSYAISIATEHPPRNQDFVLRRQTPGFFVIVDLYAAEVYRKGLIRPISPIMRKDHAKLCPICQM
jgi:hypothetical protein